MQNKVNQNKEFCTVRTFNLTPRHRSQVQKPISIKELLKASGPRLTALKARSADRSAVLERVRAALPPPLAGAVVSAGIELGRLTIGVTGAVWASRLRYATAELMAQLNDGPGAAIRGIRIKVVPPRP